MNTAPSIAPLLNNTAAHSRPQLVRDGQGGWPPTMQPLGTFPCRVRDSEGRGFELVIARQQAANISHIFYTLPDLDIRRGDVVEWDGLVGDVRSVRRPSIRHHLMVDVEVRQTGAGAHPNPPEQDGGEDDG